MRVFNAFCYTSVLIPPDINIIQKPSFLYNPLNIRWFDIVGLIFIVLGVIILLSSILKRRSIGAQDTDGMLLTTGVYSFCRHPIYFGIIILSLGFSLRSINIDSLLIFPLILLLNYIQAKIEEVYDVGIRFNEEYSKYKNEVRIFGPIWFWCTLIIVFIFPLVITLLI